MDAIGYEAVDMGPLAESWRSEPTMPVYVMPYIGEIPADLTPAPATTPASTTASPHE
jgi:hypothetical protein